jgi:hypothetical protein
VFALLLGTAGCDKEEVFCDSDFCLYADVENFYKTAPFINEYLSSLSKDWDDEQKLQALVSWLSTHSCVIDAKLREYNPHSGPWTSQGGRIDIFLDDNGITRELILNVQTVPSLIATGYSYPTPEKVIVCLERDAWNPVAVKEVIDFINLFDLEVKTVSSQRYFSTLQSDSCLNNILNHLKSKPYVSQASITMPYITSGRAFNIILNNMKNKDNQEDWLKFTSDYEIFHQANAYVVFQVPDGKEREWITKFETYELVARAYSDYVLGRMD